MINKAKEKAQKFVLWLEFYVLIKKIYKRIYNKTTKYAKATNVNFDYKSVYISVRINVNKIALNFVRVI